MSLVAKKRFLALFFGDFLFFYAALWLTLFFRRMSFPEQGLFVDHVAPFSILFVIWFLVFFASGLYDHHTLIFKKKLPGLILRVQIFNLIIAGLFFFFVPYFGVSPKTNLIIYLLVSFGLLYGWRIIFSRLSFNRRLIRSALLIGSGPEIFELKEEINGNNYGFKFSAVLDPNLTQNDLFLEIENIMTRQNFSEVVVDLSDPRLIKILPVLNQAAFVGFRVFDSGLLYEEIFGKIPLSCLREDWVFEKISIVSKPLYDGIKRIFDFSVGLILFVLSLVFYLPVMMAIKIEDRGPIFVVQKRAGQKGKVIYLRKFRSMTFNEDGAWLGETKNKVTRVGRFIRKFRIDELPQLLNVIKGDLSLIGPRPDILGLEKRLRSVIPFYGTRYVVKPGLSGWAQVKQDFVPQSVEETKDRLSYDLYYIKNRSFFLDLSIGLRTLKTIISRSGV